MNPARVALAVLVWSGVLLQLWLSCRLALANGKSLADGLIVYFGYYTVLTNILVALVLTSSLFVRHTAFTRLFANAQVWGCAATSIALVGLAYHFLLRGIWQPQGLQWLADFLLHYATPVLFSVSWVFLPSRYRLRWWSPFIWCVYPGCYFVYALIRGHLLGTYPYPFIDVTALGYGAVLLNALGLLVAFVLLAWVFLLCRAGVMMIAGKPDDR